MPTSFDPYHLMLGIPPEHQPLDHYRLLGIEWFELNLDVIHSAAERQLDHVKRHGTDDMIACSRMGEQIKEARNCLLDQETHREYAAALRKTRSIPGNPRSHMRWLAFAEEFDRDWDDAQGQEFDAQHHWLGIPPRVQPASAYRLLGLCEGESDPEVIRSAAERQIAHVRKRALGQQGEQANELLRLLSRMRSELLRTVGVNDVGDNGEWTPPNLSVADDQRIQPAFNSDRFFAMMSLWIGHCDDIIRDRFNSLRNLSRRVISSNAYELLLASFAVFDRPLKKWSRLNDHGVIAISLVVFFFLICAAILANWEVREPDKWIIYARFSDPLEPELEKFSTDVPEIDEVASIKYPERLEDLSELLEIVEPIKTSEWRLLSQEQLTRYLNPSRVPLRIARSRVKTPLGSRESEHKNRMLREYGGTASSEAAVIQALKWMARHQLPNGAWTFEHHLVCESACGDPGAAKFAKSLNAATAMALLSFLGAGETHLQGAYKSAVQRGLRYLIQNGKLGRQSGLQVRDYRDAAGTMYSHALSTIALCEAYAMTNDPALAGPAQEALNFIISAQCTDGGWRYKPRQADGGDTSVVGWQLSALKTGYMAHLTVPPQVVRRSQLFLDKVQSKGGATYGYTAPTSRIRPACTAIGLLCRMYGGWDRSHPGLVQGVNELGKLGVLKNDIYYDYYAAQVLRHYGGEEWDRFNVEVRDWLVATQSQQGGAKGSWHFPGSAHGPSEGGRLASTSFATLILEVYYRHVPLYEPVVEMGFPL